MKHNNSSKTIFFSMKNSPHIHTHIERILNAHSLVTTADKDTSFIPSPGQKENY